MTWTFGNKSSSVDIEVSIFEAYLRIFYTATDAYSGEMKNYDYKVPLTTTPCHFGGHRYWFQCPLNKNGAYCGRRVGILYLCGSLFGCRHCHNLTYSSRNISGMAKSFGSLISYPDLEDMRKKLKRTHYKGKPTRKFKRYLRKHDHADRRYIGMTMYMSEQMDKIKKGVDKKTCIVKQSKV
jgi:hypothetical protein